MPDSYDLPTVKVVDKKNPSGYVIINQADYDNDPKAYTLWEEHQTARAKAAAAPKAEAKGA